MVARSPCPSLASRARRLVGAFARSLGRLAGPLRPASQMPPFKHGAPLSDEGVI